MEKSKNNGVEFLVSVDYHKGCTVSSTICDVDANEHLTESICSALKTHLGQFNIGGKITGVRIKLRDL